MIEVNDNTISQGASEYRKVMYKAFNEIYDTKSENRIYFDNITNKLTDLHKKRKKKFLILKKVAVVLLCLFVSMGSVLAFSQEVRVFAAYWFRGVFKG